LSTPATAVVIGLSAVVVAVRDREAVALTVRTHDPRTGEPSSLLGLPFGPFDPDGHRTFELALRAFVTQQTRFELGYVEQLYTFGDRGRDAPRADVGAGAARVISVGYLALTPQAVRALGPDTVWTPLTRFFPWEDWRSGRPALIDEAIAPGLADWASSEERRARMRLLFALDGAPWNEERVLERYELLYERPRLAATASGPVAWPALSPGPCRRRLASPCCRTTGASWPPALGGCAAS
jgi:hypothetical protein